MSTHTDKTQENKTSSGIHQVPETRDAKNSTFQLLDNRPESRLAAQLQGMGDTYVSRQPPPIQKKENNTGLPDKLKSGIENLSGYAMDDVKVHYNSNKPSQLQAHAYAQGTDIHLASGQEKHLPHEAWHVVQQKQGRVKPTMQMKGKVNVNDDVGLEREADVMGDIARSNAQNDIVHSLKTIPIKSENSIAQRFKTNLGNFPINPIDFNLVAHGSTESTESDSDLSLSKEVFLREAREIDGEEYSETQESDLELNPSKEFFLQGVMENYGKGDMRMDEENSESQDYDYTGFENDESEESSIVEMLPDEIPQKQLHKRKKLKFNKLFKRKTKTDRPLIKEINYNEIDSEAIDTYLEERHITKEDIDTYIDSEMPMPEPIRFSGEDNFRGQLFDLFLKKIDGKEHSIRDEVVARGSRKQNLVNTIINSREERTQVFGENLEVLSNMAINAKNKGACDFVAREIASYLNSCGLNASATNLQTMVTKDETNHACAYVKCDNLTIIIDATWSQFIGQLGIEGDYPRTLFGTFEEIKVMLVGLGANGKYLDSLLNLYKKL